MGMRITKMFLIFINIIRAEEEMRCFISISHSVNPPYIKSVIDTRSRQSVLQAIYTVDLYVRIIYLMNYNRVRFVYLFKHVYMYRKTPVRRNGVLPVK